MTKPKALRNYFKKMYGVDIDAMSSVGVLKQFFKEKYDFDAEGSTVSEVLTSVLDSDIEPSAGGSSDFSTANVTINGFPEGSTVPVFGAFAVDLQGDEPMSLTSPEVPGNGNYTVVMYKGSAGLAALNSSYVITSVTGDIEIMNGSAFVHGDGTITFANSSHS